MKFNNLGLALVLFLLLVVSSEKIWAQPTSGIMKALGPWSDKGPPFSLSGKYGFSLFSQENVKFQPGTDLRSTGHDFSLFAPLYKDERNEINLLGKVGVQDFKTTASFPATAASFPSELWEIDFGLTYRHLFDNGWIAGGNFSLGSDSDDPFRELEVTSIMVNAFLRLPQGEKNAFLFTLNYSNTRTFAANIPIPGVAYWYEPAEWFRLVAGVPFVLLEVAWPKNKNFKVRASYFIIRKVFVEFAFEPGPYFKIYANFQWHSESYLRRGRRFEDHRLYYYDKRIEGRVKYALNRQVTLEASAGFHFDRFYFEGEDYDDKDENLIEVEKGGFGRVQISVRF